MNIALPAIVIFFVLFPGFLARARFKLVKHQSLDYSPFGKAVAEAVILAGLLHALWLYGSAELFHKHLETDSFLHLLTSNSSTQSNAISTVAQNWRWVVLYFVTLIGACLIIPPGIQYLIINCRLDSQSHPWLSRLFRFEDAGWYYLLNGNDQLKEPEVIYVTAIVQVDNKATLYNGIISDYAMDKDGKLDYLLLINVNRRNLEESDSAKSLQELEDATYPIAGNFFVLRYSETITLNIEYYFFPEVGV